MKTMLAAVLATVAAASPAAAQYYAPPPPPPPGYYPPPPPPGYYPRPVRIGRHCEAFVEAPYGPRRLFCRIVDPKPVGEECACPSPPPAPGYPYGPYVGGRTVP